MDAKKQLAALEQASSLIFSVEQVRRAGDDFDQRIAQACYLARVELGKVDSECRIELGQRERRWYNSICANRPASTLEG